MDQPVLHPSTISPTLLEFAQPVYRPATLQPLQLAEGSPNGGHELAPTHQPEIATVVREIDVNADDLTFWGKVKDIARAARADFKNTNWRGKGVIGGYVGTVGYEFMLGNEVVAPAAGGLVMDASHGVGSLALTGAVTGGIVLAEQLGAGWFARKTTQQFPKVSGRAYEYRRDEGEDDSRLLPFAELPKTKKLYLSTLLGNNAVVPREGLATKDLSDETLKKASRASALITSATVSVIAVTADAVDQIYPDNSWVQFAVDHGLTNPVFWVGVGVLGLTYDKIKNRIHRHKAKKEVNDGSATVEQTDTAQDQ